MKIAELQPNTGTLLALTIPVVVITMGITLGTGPNTGWHPHSVAVIGVATTINGTAPWALEASRRSRQREIGRIKSGHEIVTESA